MSGQLQQQQLPGTSKQGNIFNGDDWNLGDSSCNYQVFAKITLIVIAVILVILIIMMIASKSIPTIYVVSPKAASGRARIIATNDDIDGSGGHSYPNHNNDDSDDDDNNGDKNQVKTSAIVHNADVDNAAAAAAATTAVVDDPMNYTFIPPPPPPQQQQQQQQQKSSEGEGSVLKSSIIDEQKQIVLKPSNKYSKKSDSFISNNNDNHTNIETNKNVNNDGYIMTLDDHARQLRKYLEAGTLPSKPIKKSIFSKLFKRKSKKPTTKPTISSPITSNINDINKNLSSNNVITNNSNFDIDTNSIIFVENRRQPHQKYDHHNHHDHNHNQANHPHSEIHKQIKNDPYFPNTTTTTTTTSMTTTTNNKNNNNNNTFMHENIYQNTIQRKHAAEMNGKPSAPPISIDDIPLKIIETTLMDDDADADAATLAIHNEMTEEDDDIGFDTDFDADDDVDDVDNADINNSNNNILNNTIYDNPSDLNDSDDKSNIYEEIDISPVNNNYDMKIIDEQQQRQPLPPIPSTINQLYTLSDSE